MFLKGRKSVAGGRWEPCRWIQRVSRVSKARTNAGGNCEALFGWTVAARRATRSENCLWAAALPEAARASEAVRTTSAAKAIKLRCCMGIRLARKRLRPKGKQAVSNL